MKKIIGFLIMLATLVGCSKNDDVFFSISQEEISFDVSGEEQIISITTNGEWSCKYSADWILVREQQNKIRIIADRNSYAEPRMAIVQVLCNGNVCGTITVNQAGVLLEVDKTNIDATSAGGVQSIILHSNSSDYTIECTDDWLDVKRSEDAININVQRNYSMEDRMGKIIITQGAVTKTLYVTQKASQWFNSFQMIDVEGGTFFIGAQKDNPALQEYDKDAYPIESPVHSVTLSNYSIGIFEVTQAQWVAAMGNNPSIHQGENLPVENVSWNQVQEFIKLLNQKSGLNYRLPTEAEWEYAAKGGAKSQNNKFSGYSVLAACGWYYSTSESSTHEVGKKYPNELGLYDMSGNVREWCNDWFDYYTTAKVNNPQGPNSGNMKINRGGSWSTPAINCRNCYRHTDFPNEGSHDLGFRLALSE